MADMNVMASIHMRIGRLLLSITLPLLILVHKLQAEHWKDFLFSKPIMLGTGIPFKDYSLLKPLILNEFNTRRFVWKSIDEDYNIHGQNRLL